MRKTVPSGRESLTLCESLPNKQTKKSNTRRFNGPKILLQANSNPSGARGVSFPSSYFKVI